MRHGSYLIAAGLTAAQAFNGGYFAATGVLTPADPMYGFIAGRNRTMTQKIESFFELHPEEPILLAIVGRSHVPGMTRLLQDQGFQLLPMPAGGSSD